MKILVIGGMHGNEPLGVELVRFFDANPLVDIDAVLANEQAIKGDCRYIKNDLNRSFPGNLTSADYETRRAAELIELAKAYDFVLDFHNTHCPDNDCGFVGEDAPQQLYNLASLLGLDKIIVADYDCLNKYANNCLSVEVSLSSKLMNVQIWYELIAKLAQQPEPSTGSGLVKYKFVYRMTLEDKQRLGLERKKLKAFQPIDEGLARSMGVKSPAYPIFIADKYTPYNYGGLLNRFA